jgi:trigger factor
MKSTVTTINPVKKGLDFELEAEEVGPAYDKIIEDYARRVKVPGFRAGHAPREMIKRLFPDELRSALIDEIAPRALAESLKTNGLNPVTVPLIHDIEFEEQKPLRFKATIEVWPEFALPEYRKVRVTRVVAKVEDSEIDGALEQLRQKFAEYVPIEDRGVADGDYVVVEWKGRDLAAKRLMPTEKAVVIAGHQENERILNENLTGVRPGEEREFQIDHPADHANKKIAGKSVLYKMKVQGIKAKKVPEINDDLAKSVGEGDTLPELRERLRQEILRSREKSARNAMAEEILKTLTEGLTIELPEGLVEKEAESLVRRRFGAPAEDVAKTLAPEALAEFRTQTRAQARQSLLNHVILSRIARQENMSVSEEELTEELKSLAQANRVPLAKLRESLEKDERLDEVRETLLLRKAIDLLINEAIIVESSRR